MTNRRRYRGSRDESANEVGRSPGERVLRGPRIVGLALIINAAFIGSVLHSTGTGPVRTGSAVLLGVLFGALSFSAAWWIGPGFRLVAVIAVASFTLISMKSWSGLAAFVEIGLALSAAVILIGGRRRERTRWGQTAMMGCIGLPFLGLAIHLSVGGSTGVHNGAPSAVEEGRYRGRELGYSFCLAGREWRMWSRRESALVNPAADYWFSNPANDGQVVIIEERIPDSLKIDFDRLVEEVVRNSRREADAWVLVERSSIVERGTVRSMRMTASATVDDIRVTYRFGIFAGATFALQVVCLSRSESYGELEGAFEELINSVALDDSLVFGGAG